MTVRSCLFIGLLVTPVSLYTGRDMREAHAHLHVSEREWKAMLADFRASLNKFDVPAAEQSELVDIVSSTKADIVATP